MDFALIGKLVSIGAFAAGAVISGLGVVAALEDRKCHLATYCAVTFFALTFSGIATAIIAMGP